jgi:hypothetical protein
VEPTGGGLMARWIRSRKIIEVVYALRGFKRGDEFKCGSILCSTRDKAHYFHGWDDDEEDDKKLRISETADGNMDWGPLGLDEILAWKPSEPEKK